MSDLWVDLPGKGEDREMLTQHSPEMSSEEAQHTLKVRRAKRGGVSRSGQLSLPWNGRRRLLSIKTPWLLSHKSTRKR